MKAAAYLTVLMVLTVLCGAAAAEVTVDIKVETDQDANTNVETNADGNVNSNSEVVAGGSITANNYYLTSDQVSASGEGAGIASAGSGSKIVANNYFGSNGGVEVYFNDVNWEDLPNNTLITTHTHEELYKLEPDQQSATGAMDRALKEVADYRTGKSKSIGYVEYSILESLAAFTGAEVRDITGPEFTKVYGIIGDTRDEVNVNRKAINSNSGRIGGNSEAIVGTQESLERTNYAVEAIDMTLKMMDKDLYCENLRNVMNEHGIDRVKCDLNSRMCYNGDRFPFEGGRDYCVKVDEANRPVGCYADGDCGHVLDVSVGESEEEGFIPVTVKFDNPADKERQPWLHMKVVDEDDEVQGTCDLRLGDAAPNTVSTFTVECDNEGITPGTYAGKVTVESAGKEVYDEVEVTIYPEGVFDRQGVIVDVAYAEPEEGEDLNVAVKVRNTGTKGMSYPVSATLTGESGFETQAQDVYVDADETESLGFTFPVEDTGDYVLTVELDDVDEVEHEITVSSTITTVLGNALVHIPSGGSGIYLPLAVLLYFALKNRGGREWESNPTGVPRTRF